MQDLGKGIATVGIWAAVGVVAFAPGTVEAIAFVAFWAAAGTAALWLFGRNN